MQLITNVTYYKQNVEQCTHVRLCTRFIISFAFNFSNVYSFRNRASKKYEIAEADRKIEFQAMNHDTRVNQSRMSM